MGQTNTVCPFWSYHCPSSPKVATAKGRTGSPGYADQPSLAGPMAHPVRSSRKPGIVLPRTKPKQ